MEAPKCRLCGEKHWGACPAYASKAAPTPSLKEGKQRARAEIAQRNSKLRDEIIAELEAEVRQLKRQLAEANAKPLSNVTRASNVASNVTNCPVCEARKAAATARVRRHRAAKSMPAES
jgi:hypothetical protein